MSARARRLLLVVPLALAAACGSTPPPIAYGDAECDYCRMQITDPRYGGQLVTTTGKTYEFDSVECLAEFAATFERARVRAVRVADFANPGTLLPADEARFFRDSQRSGPMGGGWLAVAAADTSLALPDAVGAPHRWMEVQRLAAREDLHGAASRDTVGHDAR